VEAVGAKSRSYSTDQVSEQSRPRRLVAQGAQKSSLQNESTVAAEFVAAAEIDVDAETGIAEETAPCGCAAPDRRGTDIAAECTWWLQKDIVLN
jgi:hypothetical protein